MNVFERILDMVQNYIKDLSKQQKEAVNNNSKRAAELIEAELVGVKTVLVIAMTEMRREDEKNEKK